MPPQKLKQTKGLRTWQNKICKTSENCRSTFWSGNKYRLTGCAKIFQFQKASWDLPARCVVAPKQSEHKRQKKAKDSGSISGFLPPNRFFDQSSAQEYNSDQTETFTHTRTKHVGLAAAYRSKIGPGNYKLLQTRCRDTISKFSTLTSEKFSENLTGTFNQPKTQHSRQFWYEKHEFGIGRVRRVPNRSQNLCSF